MINYTQGDATQPQGEGPKVIVHCCNNVGAWGAGFVMALSRRWEKPEQFYRRLFRSGYTPALGFVQLVRVEDDLMVANLIGQNGIGMSSGIPIRYEAIRKGMKTLRYLALKKGMSIHMPRIGCGLAGGTWDRMGPLLEEVFEGSGLSVTVYDFK